jgi:lysophospholipase L1-like esterase
MEKGDTNITHNRYGILAGFSTFTAQPVDTARLIREKQSAWISITESPYSYQNTKKFDQCRLFYGNNTDSFSVKLTVNDELADEGVYAPTMDLHQIQWFFNEPVNNVHFELESTISPEVYGIALDAKSGVAVDNIAMRGCAGLVFNKTNAALFSELVKKLEVKLMILQFGGNVVPNIRTNYSFYERWFYAQLAFIKQHAPGVQIIVIGPSDMSRKVKNRYESYPNIELIRDALKKATFRANAAYWDMYEAMGGQNSMPSWVFAEPSLATKDFVHFTPRGAKIIANMFYNAFMYEYVLYGRNKSLVAK